MAMLKVDPFPREIGNLAIVKVLPSVATSIHDDLMLALTLRKKKRQFGSEPTIIMIITSHAIIVMEIVWSQACKVHVGCGESPEMALVTTFLPQGFCLIPTRKDWRRLPVLKILYSLQQRHRKPTNFVH